MKTDDLIKALAQDNTTALPPARALAPKLVIALSATIVVLLVELGLRPDLLSALHNPLVVLKFLFSGTIAAVGVALSLRAARPEINPLDRALWLVVPFGLVVAGVGYDLATSPSSLWGTQLVGRYPQYCVSFIPLLSLLSLAAMLSVLRNAAPARPVVAGALAGLTSGGLAAFVYALHCPDDSAMFQAVWYTLAVSISTLIGAVAGRRLLVW